MPRDFFLGVGGTASSNIFGRYLFNRPGWGLVPTTSSARPAIIIMSGVDSGGSIGTQNDLLELNAGELNELLHEDSHFPFQSYGDLKHFIISSLRYKSPEIPWKDYWDFRSDDLPEQEKKFRELSGLLGLNPKLEQDFLKYLRTYLDYAAKNQSQLADSRQKPACLGNLLLAFWHFRAGQLNDLSQFLVDLGLIPDWVEFVFVSSKRTHLQGRDKQDQMLLGEHFFDEWPEPVWPHSHKIHNDRLDVCLLNPKLNSLLASLQPEDRLILTPGSDSNWLGLFNHAGFREKIRHQPIHWLANLFRFSSETTLNETLNHVNSLGLYPQVYLPNQDFVEMLLARDNLDSLLSYVFGEQKIPQIIYLPRYRELIITKIEGLQATNRLTANQSKLLEVLLMEMEVVDKPSVNFQQQANLRYEVEVTHLDTRYAHDREYAEQWLSGG
jgi:hypothetical protein